MTRRPLAVLLATTVSAANAVAALPAWASPGPAPRIFPIATQANGANDEADVVADDDGTSHVVWVDDDDVNHPVIKVCAVPRGATGCVGTTASVPPPMITGPAGGQDGISKVMLRRNPVTGHLAVVIGGANETYLYDSADNGASFAAQVSLSTKVDATDVAYLPDGTLALVGVGNENNGTSTVFVDVRADGSDRTKSGLTLGGGIGQTSSVAVVGGRPWVAGWGFPDASASTVYKTQVFVPGTGPLESAATWTTRVLDGNLSEAVLRAHGTTAVLTGLAGFSPYYYPISYALTATGATLGKITAQTSVQDSFKTHLAVSHAGLFTATWYRLGTPRSLYLARSVDGVHWSKPRVVAPANDETIQSNRAAVASDGTGLIMQDTPPYYRAVRIWVGTGWKVSLGKASKGKRSVSAQLVTELGKPAAKVKVSVKVGSKTKTVLTDGSGKVKLLGLATARKTAITFTWKGNSSLDPSSVSVVSTTSAKAASTSTTNVVPGL